MKKDKRYIVRMVTVRTAICGRGHLKEAGKSCKICKKQGRAA